jgi:hypothetical protein
LVLNLHFLSIPAKFFIHQQYEIKKKPSYSSVSILERKPPQDAKFHDLAFSIFTYLTSYSINPSKLYNREDQNPQQVFEAVDEVFTHATFDKKKTRPSQTILRTTKTTINTILQYLQKKPTKLTTDP